MLNCVVVFLVEPLAFPASKSVRLVYSYGRFHGLKRFGCLWIAYRTYGGRERARCSLWSERLSRVAGRCSRCHKSIGPALAPLFIGDHVIISGTNRKPWHWRTKCRDKTGCGDLRSGSINPAIRSLHYAWFGFRSTALVSFMGFLEIIRVCCIFYGSGYIPSPAELPDPLEGCDCQVGFVEFFWSKGISLGL